MVYVKHCSSCHKKWIGGSPHNRENCRAHKQACSKTISSDKHIVLLVDGHSSRDGLEWLETCERLNIIVVRLPANTSHILQPCGQYVNRSFQRTVRNTRDELLSMSHLSWANTSYKIKLAVSGHQSITPDDARASFVKCCMWPMAYRFIYLAPSDGSSDGIETRFGTSCSSAASPFVTQTRHGVMRTQNIKLQNEIHQLTDGRLPASRALAQVSCLLQSNYRVHNILSHEIRAPKTASCSRTARKIAAKCRKRRFLLRMFLKGYYRLKTSNCDHASSQATKTHSRISWKECFDGKENVDPAREANVARNLERRFSDSLDDVPLSEWPTRSRVGVRGKGESCETGVQHAAAGSLLSLSQLR